MYLLPLSVSISSCWMTCSWLLSINWGLNIITVGTAMTTECPPQCQWQSISLYMLTCRLTPPGKIWWGWPRCQVAIHKTHYTGVGPLAGSPPWTATFFVFVFCFVSAVRGPQWWPSLFTPLDYRWRTSKEFGDQILNVFFLIQLVPFLTKAIPWRSLLKFRKYLCFTCWWDELKDTLFLFQATL